MELSLRATLTAQIEGDGSIVLPGKTFADIARLLPADEVSIEHKPAESVVHVTSGTASYTLHTYNPEDFPRLPELAAVTTFAVEREPLLETIHRVARAASRDESRPVLTGILVQFTAGTLVMAATDSYRLAVKQTTLEGTVPELEAIVPARALQELARIATSGDEVEVGVIENQVIFVTGSASSGARVAHDAPHRWPVPELQAAAARGVRVRAHGAAPRAARRREASRRDDPALHAAADPFRRGRADRDRATTRSASRRSRCRSGSPARRSRWASTPTSCGTGSSRSKATTYA
jgi:DNA polymerase sliding clamp subunit (PCNA homolog)